MGRFTTCLLALVLLAVACADDQIALTRGPLRRATYEVVVSAEGDITALHERHEATLRISPTDTGARMELRATDGNVVEADLRRAEDGSLGLERVEGALSGGQTEFASIVGQLDPPLPDETVRIGERWAATRRIDTQRLQARIRTSLKIIRFTRVASTNVAELAGNISGRLTVRGDDVPLEGTLEGTTTIMWAVTQGRVVRADTQLDWMLPRDQTVRLNTEVRPV